jgi:AmiR/NasT family two-component response regulator
MTQTTENIDNSNEQVSSPKPKAEKAKKFRQAFGYSLTMSKLMKKYDCSSPEAYRKIRNKNKKSRHRPVAAKK